MKRLIQKIEPSIPLQPRLLRVAAYARVSNGKDAMLHSLSAQVSYYSELIQGNPEWLFCGIYADEALTGTKSNRAEFQKMLTACRNGEIDLVITKSISRFARNTVTLCSIHCEQPTVWMVAKERSIHELFHVRKHAAIVHMMTVQNARRPRKIRTAPTVQKHRTGVEIAAVIGSVKVEFVVAGVHDRMIDVRLGDIQPCDLILNFRRNFGFCCGLGGAWDSGLRGHFSCRRCGFNSNSLT